MNNRIRELAEEARLLTGWPVGEVEYQKFAELIVAECIEQVEVFNARMDAGPRHIVEAIKQHFGVKE